MLMLLLLLLLVMVKFYDSCIEPLPVHVVRGKTARRQISVSLAGRFMGMVWLGNMSVCKRVRYRHRQPSSW